MAFGRVPDRSRNVVCEYVAGLSISKCDKKAEHCVHVFGALRYTENIAGQMYKVHTLLRVLHEDVQPENRFSEDV